MLIWAESLSRRRSHYATVTPFDEPVISSVRKSILVAQLGCAPPMEIEGMNS